MKITLRTGMLLLLSGITISQTTLLTPAYAGWLKKADPFNKNSDIRRGGRNIDPTNRKGRVGRKLHAKFTICNYMNRSVAYNVNNRRDTLAAYNPRRSPDCTNWTTTGQALINFDSSYIRGYQGKTYRLNDGRYRFYQASRYTHTSVGKAGWPTIGLARY